VDHSFLEFAFSAWDEVLRHGSENKETTMERSSALSWKHLQKQAQMLIHDVAHDAIFVTWLKAQQSDQALGCCPGRWRHITYWAFTCQQQSETATYFSWPTQHCALASLEKLPHESTALLSGPPLQIALVARPMDIKATMTSVVLPEAAHGSLFCSQHSRELRMPCLHTKTEPARRDDLFWRRTSPAFGPAT
jgi:hypothetical protein